MSRLEVEFVIAKAGADVTFGLEEVFGRGVIGSHNGSSFMVRNGPAYPFDASLHVSGGSCWW